MPLSLREKRAAALSAAQTIVDAAKASNRDLTKSELETVNTKFAEIDDLDEKIVAAEKSMDVMHRIEGLGSGNGDGARRLALTGRGAKATATRLVKTFREDGPEFRKALVESGSTAVDSPLITGVATMRQVPTSILEVLPAKPAVAPSWQYLRQTVRTNNAAIVAPGALKPTSTYTVAKIDNHLEVFAHVSEPVDSYLVGDNDSLTLFLTGELTNGIGLAVEDEVINGDGTAGHFRGILNTSGIQTQAAAADPITTLRAGATQLESAGYETSVFIVNVLDWAAMETARNTSGAFDLDGPVDRAQRKAWGVQVVTSTRLAQGTALAIDASTAASIVTDQRLVASWSNAVDDDFQRNQVRCRVEGRFALEVRAPNAIVKITLPTG